MQRIEINAEEETKAKQFLRKRLDEEIAGQNEIKEKILNTFISIVNMCYAVNILGTIFTFASSGLEEKIDKIIKELRTYIYMIIESRSNNVCQLSKDKNGKDIDFFVSPFINQEVDGHTLNDRIDQYVDNLKYEFETWIAGALSTKMNVSDVTSSFISYRTNPYNNPVFNQARKLDMKATRFITDGVNFGVGQYVSGENSIIRLERIIVAQTYKNTDFRIWSENGALYVVVGRGSSYPCDLCDSMVGVHPVLVADIPPFHSRCVCWSYPLYKNDF